MATKKTETAGATESSPSSNMRIWDALCNTDPAQTKQFKRGGGFSGTATKPIWTTMRMTEQFGPCGIGWGMDKPDFQVITCGEEILVFCTVRLWYKDGDAIATVYGVGGDKVVGKNKFGLTPDDESFKKSYTDAVGNAEKYIGVCADIHMGMFDDSKYVREMAEQFADEPQAPPVPPAPPLPDVDQSTVIRLVQAIEAAKTLEDLDGIWARSKTELVALKNKMPEGLTEVTNAAKNRKTQITEKAA